MKQVCDYCQHLFSGPVCEECFPNELDAKNQIIKIQRAAIEKMQEALYPRFWSKVKVLKKNQCWEWSSYIAPNGYGFMSVNNKPKTAHRIAYEYANGEIPKGLWIDHKCRNRKCVNPNHLRAVTPKINAIENSVSTAAINAKKTHCPSGHEYSEDNTKIKFNHRLGRPQRRCKVCEKFRKRRQRADKSYVLRRIRSKAAYLSNKYGGKWKYDGVATWYCDDKKRSVSRTANMLYDGNDNYGDTDYYLYGDGETRRIVWGE